LAGGYNIGTDITVNDIDATNGGLNSWAGGSPDRRTAFPYGSSSGTKISVNEDQEVRAGAQQGQGWDLEGMFFNSGGNRLSIIGGYDFLLGNAGYTSGDMLVDITPFGDTNGPVTSSINYVIKFDWSTAPTTWSGDKVNIGYTIYKMGDAADGTWQASTFFPTSDPWRYSPHNSDPILDKGVATVLRNVGSVTSDASTSNSVPYTFQGTDRFALMVGAFASEDSVSGYDTYKGVGAIFADAAAVLGSPLQEFGGKFTMQCGNDEILGFKTNSNQLQVPDVGSTSVLLGLALLGLGLVIRRK
jgi:hypothetical protein